MASSAQSQMTELPFRQNMKCFHIFAFFAGPKLCKTYRSYVHLPSNTVQTTNLSKVQFLIDCILWRIGSTLGLNKSAVIIHRILPNMIEPVKSRDISENQLKFENQTSKEKYLHEGV